MNVDVVLESNFWAGINDDVTVEIPFSIIESIFEKQDQEELIVSYVENVVKPSWENVYEMDIEEYENQLDEDEDDDEDVCELISNYEDCWEQGDIIVYIDAIREEYNKIKNGEK